MKKFNSILVFVLFVSTGLMAQTVVPQTLKNGIIPSRYNRNAITVVILDNNGSYISDIKKAAGGIIVPEKYDNNNLDIRYIPAESSSGQIQKGIESNKLANKILAKWFSRKSGGEFEMSLIAERGLYNATADDMIKASASKIGLEKIKDAGKSLVNNSYIQVLDIRNVLSMQEYYDKQDAANRTSAASSGKEFKPVERTQNGWKGEVTSYLYKIDPTAIDTLYEKMWIYDDDSNTIRKEKRELFVNATFGFDFVMSVNTSTDGTQYNPGQLLAPKVQLTKHELFVKLVNTALNQSMVALETKYEPFRVKTSVYAVHPIGAKIGTKEGLSVDQRFFVLENIQNNKGEIVSKRHAVVRVSKIANNSVIANTESVSLSKFYQTAGKSIDAGMTMQQRNDFGLGISIGGGSLLGGMGGIYIKAEENIAVLSSIIHSISITQLKVFGSYTLDSKTYPGDNNTYAFGRYQLGISKGFYFFRNFSINPFIAYGGEKATCNAISTDYNMSTAFINIGAYATINIKHNIQLVGTANYYLLFGNAYDETTNTDGTTTQRDLGYKYDDSLYGFSDRKGLAIDLGLRIEL